MRMETWLEQATQEKRSPRHIRGEQTFMTPQRLAEAIHRMGHKDPQAFAPVLGLHYHRVLDMLRGKIAVPRYVALAVRALENSIDV